MITRRHRWAAVLGVATIIASVGFVAAPAQAATVTIDYELDGTEPIWSRVNGTSVPCAAPFGGDYHYLEQALTVDVDGTYTFWDSGYMDGGLADGFLAVYTAFDPTTPLSGCIGAFDDNGPSGASISLTAGTVYTVVLSTFSPGAITTTRQYQFSASGPGTVTVTPFLVDTTTTLTASPNPATAPAPVTLTATVAGGAPTGSVEFFAGGVSLGVSIVVDGVAVLHVPLPAGTHSLTAVYSGDPGHLGSSSEPVEQVVVAAPAAQQLPATGGEPGGALALAGLLLGLGIAASGSASARRRAG